MFLSVVVDGSVNMCNVTPVTSRCDTVLGLCDGATRLQVTDKPCDKCNLHLILAEYPKVRLVTVVTSPDESLTIVTIAIGLVTEWQRQNRYKCVAHATDLHSFTSLALCSGQVSLW